jgi:polyphosphate kinase
MFSNGGRPEWYMGSADLMERNLDRRGEGVTPVEAHEAQARLTRIIEVMLADDRRSWQLSPDGRWERIEVLESREGTVETFAVLKEDATIASAAADIPHRPHAHAGSLDPRA